MAAELRTSRGLHWAACVDHDWESTSTPNQQKAFEDGNSHNLVNHLPAWLRSAS